MKRRSKAKQSRTSAESGRGHSPDAMALVVGSEVAVRDTLVSSMPERCRCTCVADLAGARDAFARGRFDLLVVDPDLPDGDGLDVAELARSLTPWAKTVVVTPGDSFPVAQRALRCGVVDYIRTPVPPAELAGRLDAALSSSLAHRQRERRVARLQRLCHELSEARAEIADQVDGMCRELAAAYQDLTEQVNDVAMASEFRTLLRQELDMEELLRTTLEYLLGKIGPTNAAVFLPDQLSQFSLGAYVNYDCPRVSIDRLLDHLCEAICPQMTDETELVCFEDAAEFSHWIGMDDELIADAQVVAFSCLHEGECLAVVVLFRNRSHPFEPRLAGTLDILRTIFAEQLAQVIRVHHRAAPSWPDEADDGDWDDDFGDEFDCGFEGGGLAA